MQPCRRCGANLPQYTVLCTLCGVNQYQLRLPSRGLLWTGLVGLAFGAFGLALAL